MSKNTLLSSIHVDLFAACTNIKPLHTSFPPLFNNHVYLQLNSNNPTLTTQDLTKPRLTYSSRELKELQDNIKHDNTYLALNPGAISNIHKYKINRTKINISQRHEKSPRGVNKSNLKYIRTINFSDKDLTPNIRIATLNARSVKNKDQMIVQELTNNDIDAACVTETWTKDTQEDLAWLNQFNTTDQGKKGVVVLH